VTSFRHVRRVEPPPASAIRDWYKGADLLDSYGVDAAADLATMREVAQRALDRPPLWFKALMAVRDGLVGPLGVRTSDELRRERRNRPHIDFFPVLSESVDEIVLGEDDSHLDFRVSLLRQAGPSGPMLIATTAVRTHNRLGRLYLRVIHPFHVFIVRATVARAAAQR
jgi:hypothetical protein